MPLKAVSDKTRTVTQPSDNGKQADQPTPLSDDEKVKAMPKDEMSELKRQIKALTDELAEMRTQSEERQLELERKAKMIERLQRKNESLTVANNSQSRRLRQSVDAIDLAQRVKALEELTSDHEELIENHIQSAMDEAERAVELMVSPPPKVEIKTLCQSIPDGESDNPQLAKLLNEGWQIIHMSATTKQVVTLKRQRSASDKTFSTASGNIPNLSKNSVWQERPYPFLSNQGNGNVQARHDVLMSRLADIAYGTSTNGVKTIVLEREQ